MTSASLLVLRRKGRFQVLSLFPACGPSEATPGSPWQPRPLLGESLRLILASCCPHRDLKLERVLELWLWEQSIEEWTDMCVSVSVCVFHVNTNNRWGFPNWELDMRWRDEWCLGILDSFSGFALFLEGKAVNDLTHFQLKLFDNFLSMRLVWTGAWYPIGQPF